jgi:uncharacterized protein YeaO (DUF488 family)
MANLAPSEELLQAWQEGRIATWAEFGKRYKHQLRESESTDKANKNIKNHGQKFTLRLLRQLAKRQTITLLCHCSEEQTECHRHILKEILLRDIK